MTILKMEAWADFDEPIAPNLKYNFAIIPPFRKREVLPRVLLRQFLLTS